MLSDFFNPIYVQENEIPHFKLFIGGEWRNAASGEFLEIVDPSNGQTVSKVSKATREDAENAVNVASAAFHEHAISPSERANILLKTALIITDHKDEFAWILCNESGKTISDSRVEVDAAIDLLNHTAWDLRLRKKEAREMIHHGVRTMGVVSRRPLGIVSAISPFNYPLINPVSKIAPAFAAGNSVIVKPSGEDPSVVYLLARAMEEAGMPQGLLQVLTGSSGDIGDLITLDERIAMVTFTGSTDVGKVIAKEMGMQQMHFELGGKCAGIVLNDADIMLAADECVKGAFKSAGQRCDALSRVFVHQDVYDNFIELTLSKADAWGVGDPKQDETKVGPVINADAAEHIQSLLADAVAKGANVLRGGQTHGLYVQPTILRDVSPDVRIVWEETFGPVLVAIKVSGTDEAVELNNRSQFGLDSAVFTKNINTALWIGEQLDTGSITINSHPSHGIGLIPFGGYNDSGVGFEGIGKSIDEMSKEQVVKYSRITTDTVVTF